MGWLAGWDNRVKCIIDNTNVDTTLSNFPILLRISTASGISAADLTAFFTELASDANRKKIAVTASDGTTQYYVEIESFDYANKIALIRAKYPSVASGTPSTLYLYYDADHIDNTTYVGDIGDTPAQSVFDSNFKLVQHMSQDPSGSAPQMIDSTGNSNNGTSSGAMTSADLVAGKVGKALDFDGANDYINCGAGASIRLAGARTISCWIKGTFTTATFDIIAKRGAVLYEDRDYLMYLYNKQVRGGVHDSASLSSKFSSSVAQLADETFYFIAMTWSGVDSASVVIYIDGAIDNSVISNNIFSVAEASTEPLLIGAENSAAPKEFFPGIIDEICISDINRSTAWLKATYHNDSDNLVTFSEFELVEHFYLNTSIETVRSKSWLNTEIQAVRSKWWLNTEIQVVDAGTFLADLNSEIQAGSISLTDLNVNIEVKAQKIIDLLSDIQAKACIFHDLSTSIEAVRSKWWLNTEIKAGCSAIWNFNTEWNPNRFLSTEIEAKKPYSFSFKTQTTEDYSATAPSVELKIPEYSFPIKTLFLDYLTVGDSNEYNFELWWARGLTGKGPLKNAKIKAEYINTSDAGGFEVVVLEWISCKVGEGEYQTVNETPLLLQDIPCDSKLDITLKVEARDCSLSRGLVFFRLVFTGDWKEVVFGGPIVYQDGSCYHAGIFDDYRSKDFIARLYVVN